MARLFIDRLDTNGRTSRYWDSGDQVRLVAIDEDGRREIATGVAPTLKGVEHPHKAIAAMLARMSDAERDSLLDRAGDHKITAQLGPHRVSFNAERFWSLFSFSEIVETSLDDLIG